jgi:hypothetical protein
MSGSTRVIVPIDDANPEALALSLGYAKLVAQRANSRADKIILLTHTKQQLRSTSLERHLGAQVSKALAANKAVGVGDGFTLHHETMQTLRYGGRNSIIIAFYADEKMLDFVDGLADVVGCIAVPWLEDGAKTWADRWTPHIHGKPPQEPAKILSDRVIENALRSFSRIANRSHSLMHPRAFCAQRAIRHLSPTSNPGPFGRVGSLEPRMNLQDCPVRFLA